MRISKRGIAPRIFEESDERIAALLGCRIAEHACTAVASKVLKQRVATVKKGEAILVALLEWGQAEAVVVRILRAQLQTAVTRV